MKNNKGFTFVEVVITSVIVGILAIAGTVVYKRQVDKAKYNEGLRLLQAIKEQQDLQLSFTSEESVESPFETTNTDGSTDTCVFDRSDQNLGTFEVSSKHNKYFKEFEIRAPGSKEAQEGLLRPPTEPGYVAIAYYPDGQNPKKAIRLVSYAEHGDVIVMDENPQATSKSRK